MAEPFAPLPFAEAIAWARARVVTLPDVYYGDLQGLARSMAFSVAGLAKLDQLQAVLDSLNASLATGESFAQWRKAALDPAGPVRLDLPAHRVENIFRTNVQGAYGRGRCEQQKRNTDTRPWYLYDAVNDSRTRPTHAAMDGMVARYDDPIWADWTPPSGYQCFLPGTRVEGDFRVGLKAWYAGEAVEIVSAEGVSVSVTANHPILTGRGWVKAKDIQEGDDLLRYKSLEKRGINARAVSTSARPSRVIDDKNPPPTADDLFDALATQRLRVMPRSSFNLYGDALSLKSDVYVAGADGELMSAGLLAGSDQCSDDVALKRRDHCGPCIWNKHLNAARASLDHFLRQIKAKLLQPLFNEWSRHPQMLADFFGRRPIVDQPDQVFIKVKDSPPLSSFPSGSALTLDHGAVGFDAFPFQPFGLASASQRYALALQPVAERLPAYFKAVCDRFHAFAGFVPRLDRVRRFWRPPERLNSAALSDSIRVLHRSAFDSAIAQESVEQAIADAPLFERLAHRCAGQVHIDKVVSVRNFAFSGHVYDFETENGLIAANGIITSNCRCRRIALSERQAQRFIDADRKRMQDPERSTARLNALPDKGWDYSPCAEPDEGLRRAWSAKVGKVHPVLAQAAVQAMQSPPAIPAPWTILEGDQATLDEIKRLGGERLDELLALKVPDDPGLIGISVAFYKDKPVGDVLKTSFISRLDVMPWLRGEILSRLGSARNVGGANFALVNKTGKGVKLSKRVSDKLPTSWVDKVNAAGAPYKVTISEKGRGWCSARFRELKTSSGSTAEHEWTHAVQGADPTLDGLFQSEHKKRTANDELVWLGFGHKSDEMAKRDGYVSPYQGKEYKGYGDNGALEVITMAMQAVIGEDRYANQLFADMVGKDPDMLRLALGALFHYRPKK